MGHSGRSIQQNIILTSSRALDPSYHILQVVTISSHWSPTAVAVSITLCDNRGRIYALPGPLYVATEVTGCGTSGKNITGSGITPTSFPRDADLHMFAAEVLIAHSNKAAE